MKFAQYLKDKLYTIFIFIFAYAIVLLILLAFKLDKMAILVISLILSFAFVSILFIEFFRKKSFYDSIFRSIAKLDRAYLVTSTIEAPNFYEGRLVFEILYEIDKSMIENVGNIERSLDDFKEYLEMWIHEVKIPLASLSLMVHNRAHLFDKPSLEQLRRIETYVDQVLYYIRQETSEKDYLIKEVSLQKTINAIALKNKDDLLENDISLLATHIDGSVYTDAKWLEFALNQILNNAIKYRRLNGESHIKIWTEESAESLTLFVEDDGLGIPSADIPRVFEKSFTGQNGRTRAKSTGIGLYIVKNLLEKLGHRIEVNSEVGKFTRFAITFFKNEFYDVIK